MNPAESHQAAALCCDHSAVMRLSDVGQATQGSRRARLWELPSHLHCPIIGVCLSIAALRNLVAKHYGGPCLVGEYQVHATVVQACRTRTALIESVQRELDRAFQTHIKQFQAAKTCAAVTAMWRLAVSQQASGGSTPGAFAGALWASLTHPRTEGALRVEIGHEVHMMQHKLAGETRRDASDLTRAKQLNAEHVMELTALRTKVSGLQAQQRKDTESQHQQLAEVELVRVGALAQTTALRLQLESLRQSVPDLDSREKLNLRVDDLAAQNARLKQQLIEFIGKRDAALETRGPTSTPQRQTGQVTPIVRVIDLQKKNVLCVGGRSSAVASYRKAVEQAGGRFLHHDGGVEHNHHRLDANLAAADCVICQTGCISHTAYWMVKDYCKKTGKHCVYLDKPSMSTFLDGLNHLPPCPAPPPQLVTY